MIRGAFTRIGPASFGGHAVDDDDPARILAVELLVDGMPVEVTLADAYSAALADSADPYHGFSFALPANILPDAAILEARLANLGHIVGEPIRLEAPPAAEPLSFGAVEWLGGTRFRGFIAGERDGRFVRVFVNGELVSEVPATGWRHIGTNRDDRRFARTFAFHLPPHLADGRVRRVVVADEGGSRLEGCPLAFLAFADGLAEAIERLGDIDSERPRGALFDRLFPSSVPFSEYAAWRDRFPVPPAATSGERIAVIAANGGSQAALDPDAIRVELAREQPDIAVFCLAGTELYEGAAERIAAALRDGPTRLVYGDFDLADRAGRPRLIALPAFDRERLIEQGYAAHLFALRRDALDAALAARPTSLYALCLAAVTACDGPAAIVHLPGALALLPPIDAAAATPELVAAARAHLRTERKEVAVEPDAGTLFPAARIRRPAVARVTLVLASREPSAVLERRIATLEPALARVGGDILTLGPSRGMSIAALCNTALAEVTSEAVCFVSEGITAEDDHWLEEMLGRLAGNDVGAVGPTLIGPGGRIEAAGLVLGPRFDAAPAFADHATDEPGYADALRVARECSALGEACLLTTRHRFAAAGGLDARRFPEHYAFTDFCLRLRDGGARLVVTPHARLVEERRSSRIGTPSHERERARLRDLWGEQLADDPYYSPLLGLDAEPFTALAWPPRGFAPRPHPLKSPHKPPLSPIVRR